MTVQWCMLDRDGQHGEVTTMADTITRPARAPS
jgi:hypothetical protein